MKQQRSVESLQSNNKTKDTMKPINYQGETLESLIGQLNYCNEALAFEGLENWERKEYQEVKDDVCFKINCIKEAMKK
jgi:hypothetical protein